MSSRDGFCSVIFFNENDLGSPVSSSISNNAPKEVKEIETNLNILPQVEVTTIETNELSMKVTKREEENETRLFDITQQHVQDVTTVQSDVKDHDAFTEVAYSSHSKFL